MHSNWATIFGLAQPSGAAAPVEGGQEGTAIQGAPEGGGQRPVGPCGGQDPMVTIIMMLAMFAAFYFLLIRPQQKKAKDHQKMIDNLSKGEEIVTTGGIVGRISGVTDKFFTVEISEKVRVRVLKSHVADKYTG